MEGLINAHCYYELGKSGAFMLNFKLIINCQFSKNPKILV